MKSILTVKAKIGLTETVQKVERAVKNIFPTVSTEIIPGCKGSILIAKINGEDGLARFYNRLREQRILGAAKRMLRQGLYGSSITFHLNKQAAYVERISFCDSMGESPLGSIEVLIECANPKKLIDWLAPTKVKVRKSKG